LTRREALGTLAAVTAATPVAAADFRKLRRFIWLSGKGRSATRATPEILHQNRNNTKV